MNLSEYESKDGRSLPESVVKLRKAPRQVASDKEAEALALAGETGATTMQSAAALNFMTNVCQGGSLHLVWGLIEQLQVVSYQQLLKTKLPGNVVAFLDYFEEIVIMSPPFSLEEFTESWAKFPESAIDIQANFESADIDSQFLIPNLENMLYYIAVYVALYVIYFLLRPLFYLGEKGKKIIDYLGRHLFWSGSLRFYIESYLVMTLFALLNLRSLDWMKNLDWSEGYKAMVANDILVVTLAIVSILLPVLVIVHSACNHKRWNDESYKRRHGTLLTGLDLNKAHYKESQWVIILTPAAFFVRRFILSCLLVFIDDFFWG